ncbi:MAG: ABC transporter permease [bacterium]|nr:ABC transporter permease [bacterium]
MFEILRNMFRRKLRTTLTIFGIVIGILALVVLGSLAEKMNLMMKGGEKFLTGQISVSSGAPSNEGGNPFASSGFLTQDKIRQIEKVNGVKAVQAGVETPYVDPDKKDGGGISFGAPPTIMGSDLNSTFENVNWKTLAMKSGRMITRGDKGVVVVGSDIATDKKLYTNDTMKIGGKDFKVIGVLEKTMTGPDSYIFMELGDSREVLITQNPTLKDLRDKSTSAKKTLADPSFKYLSPEVQAQIKQAANFNDEDIITGASVSWKDGVDPEKLSKDIKDKVQGVKTLSPADGKKMIQSISVLMNAVIVGSALIALVVGSLSVINTMIMSVSERKREIGVKKAVGAHDRHIIKEYLIESSAIGLLGGLLGLGIGSLIVFSINKMTESSNIQVFQVTPRLAIGALIFSITLGAVAGLYPAWHAARINPVAALKEE